MTMPPSRSRQPQRQRRLAAARSGPRRSAPAAIPGLRHGPAYCRMSHVLTLVVDRAGHHPRPRHHRPGRARSSSARRRSTLSPGEAADIHCNAPPDMQAVARRPGRRAGRRHRHPAPRPPQGPAGRRHGQHHRHQRDPRRTGRLRRPQGTHRRHHPAGHERRARLSPPRCASASPCCKGLPLAALEQTWASTPADARRARTGRHHARAQRHHRAGLRRLLLLHLPRRRRLRLRHPPLQHAARRRHRASPAKSANRSRARTPNSPRCANSPPRGG